MYHPKAFSNLSLEFDPEENVKWSANLIKNNSKQTEKLAKFEQSPINIKTVNYNEKHIVPIVEQKTKKIENSSNGLTKVNSNYILARMEKVRFFRNYFLKY